MAWLSAHRGWLLILDNVSNPGDIAPLLGRLGSGRVVVTSRLAEGWHRIGVRRLYLGVLTQQQAIELLTRLGTPPDPSSEAWPSADALVAELGCLPLAIDQAGAYLCQTGLTPAAYLDLLHDQPQVMYDRTARGSDALRTMARIWRVTLDHLTDTPLAGDVLRILAWLAPEAIPRELLSRQAEPVDLAEAFGALAAYNMITLSGEAVTVHRLVQAVARTPDPNDPHRHVDVITRARETATTLLHTALPGDLGDPATWPAARILLPHIDALVSNTPPDADTDTTDLLLFDTGKFLRGQGAYDQAISYLQRSTATSQRLHGDDHPETLTSRNNLAEAYRAAGDLKRAIPLFEQTLNDRTRILGDDDPDTLTSRDTLAEAYRNAGDLKRAIPLFEQTLNDSIRVLGDDHLQTLVTRSNLGGAYLEAGDVKRAIALFEQTLNDSIRVLGEDHPQALATCHNLAAAYRAAGNLKRAISLYEQTLTDRIRLLGEDHPQALATGDNLAAAYRAAGNLKRAISLYEQTLTDRIRVLGEDHPDTLASRNNLAGAYLETGNVVQAIPLYEQTLNDSIRLLGEDHPNTRAVRQNLMISRRGSIEP